MTDERDRTDWTLRPARPDDYDFLYALHVATLREHVDAVWGWDDNEQQVFFDRRWRRDACQVIEIDGRPGGLLIVKESPTEVYLAEIQILPEVQGRGVGTAVLSSLMDRAAAAGKPLTLGVLHVNGRARALYERLGFRQTDENETHAYLRWEAGGIHPAS